MPSDANRRAVAQTGRASENLARAFLRGLGFEILQANFHSRYGEIDIIARDGDTVCFVEVRSRSRGSLVSAAESVDGRKQGKLARTAGVWLEQNQMDCPCRFDVVEVEWTGAKGSIANHYRGCFEPRDGWEQ